MRLRSAQKAAASFSPKATAALGSRSVMMTTWLHSSGTSVKGLPIISPAAIASPLSSSARHSRRNPP